MTFSTSISQRIMKLFNPCKAGLLIGLSLHALAWTFAAAQDIAISPFGQTDYGNWKATGTAFSKGPPVGQLLATLEIENVGGNVVACSEVDGDGPTGTLTSPEFKITRRYIAFRIGGGNYEFSTSLHLLIDGKIVKSATGWRSDRLAAASWDVSKFAGQTARLQIVDAASGDWATSTSRASCRPIHRNNRPSPPRRSIRKRFAPSFTSRRDNGPWTGSIPANGKRAGSTI